MQIPPIEPLPGERVLANVQYGDQSVPFALGITDRAVYIYELDRWSLKQPWVVRRIPVEQVRQATVRRTRTVTIMALAGLMILFGGAVTFLMLLPIVQGHGGEISLLPIGILLGGALLPFAARGRRTLRVAFTNRGEYEWKPPLLRGNASKYQVHQLLDQILTGFR